MQAEKDSGGGTVQVRRAVVLAPSDAAGGLEVLVDEVAALLVVVDALDPVAPAEAVADDLGGLDLDPLLPHQVLPVLQHRHRVPVRVLRVEVIRRPLVELDLRLSHHLRSSAPPPPPSLSPTFSPWPGVDLVVGIGEWMERDERMASHLQTYSSSPAHLHGPLGGVQCLTSDLTTHTTPKKKNIHTEGRRDSNEADLR